MPFFVGDFNTRPDEPSYLILTEEYSLIKTGNTESVSENGKYFIDEATWGNDRNNFNGKEDDETLDYIFHKR